MNGEENKNQNSGTPRVPPPPPPPIAIRTMESDLKSIQQSGGGQPAPIEPASTPPRPEPPKTPEASEVKITIPGYGGPEESVFKPEAVIPPTAPSDAPSKSAVNAKVVAGIIAAVIVVAAAGFGAYYFVLPAVFPPAPETAIETAPPAAQPEATKPTLVHKSYLIQVADLTAEAKLESLSATAYKRTLAETAADNRPPGTLKEVVFVGADGVLSFVELAGALFPDLQLAGLFENDYTFLLYYNDKGVWPILIAKRTGAGAENEVKKLETSPNIENIFVADPGEIAKEGFKDGQAADFASVRYVLFSGGALNYGWTGDYLVVSASYAGFRETAKRLSAK